jgi:hypothetical protein
MKRLLGMTLIAATTLGVSATARAANPPLVITLKDSDRVLTLASPWNQGGTTITLSPFEQAPGQGFWLRPQRQPEERLFHIVSQRSQLCLDTNGSREDGTPITQKPCMNADYQLFHVSDRGADGHRELRGKFSDKCLAAPQGGDSSGSALVQWKCTGRDNQRFRISPASVHASGSSR